jgi:phosphoribosyl-dephospho-CoA transferase
MTLIDLSDQEMKLVQKFAKQRDITINQAAQIIFDAGKEQVLAIAGPNKCPDNNISFNTA